MSKKTDDVFDDFPLPPFPEPKPPGAWQKRGKVLPLARAAWGQVDANQRGHDPELGQKLLDESLG